MADDKKPIEELENYYSLSFQFLNKFSKSSKLQDFFSNAFESFFYSTLIKNFFSNLTDKNIEEFDLSHEESKKLKKEFKDVIDDIEFGLSLSLEKKIDEKYYENFKIRIKTNHPNFLKILNELEEMIDLKNAKTLMENKKEEIKGVGKKNPIIEDFIVTKAIEEYVNKNKKIPDLNDPDIIKDILNHSSKKISKEIMDKYSDMKITNWNIWHSLSTYFIEEFKDLDEIAIKLVETDLCPLVLSSKGQIWWKKNKEVKTTNLEFTYSKNGECKFIFPEISDQYVIEVLTHGIDMVLSESRVFNEKYLNSFQYLRGFLGTCRLKKDNRTISLYPQIKLYNNGVLDLSFRELGPKGFEYYINSFIENELNLSRLDLDNIEVPPALIKLNNIFRYSELPFSKKFKAFIRGKSLKKANEIVQNKTKTIKEGNFSYKLAPLKLKVSNNSGKVHLSSLYEILISSLDVIINFKYNGFIINHSNYTWGDFWISRPSVYILDFIDQPDSSFEIIDNFSNELGKIMARQYKPYHVDFSKFMSENLREFDDYCLFINKALTLWIYSKNGIRSYKDPDPNGGRIIYENQVQVEAINHLFMSHKRLFEVSSILHISYKSIIKEQLDLISLEELFIEGIGNYGEISKWHERASEILNLNGIRSLINKNLKMRSEYSHEKRDDLFKRFGLIISIIFGFFGTALFALNVTVPIWSYYGFKTPFFIPESLLTSFLVVVTGLLALVILIVLYLPLLWRNNNM
jgi:hypothetical protein